jgi:hypothetical protein
MRNPPDRGDFVLRQCTELVDLTGALNTIKVHLTLLLRQQRHPVTMAEWLGESEHLLKLSSMKLDATHAIDSSNIKSVML